MVKYNRPLALGSHPGYVTLGSSEELLPSSSLAWSDLGARSTNSPGKCNTTKMVGLAARGTLWDFSFPQGYTGIPPRPQAGTQGDLSPWGHSPSVSLQDLNPPPVWCQVWRRNPAWRWPGQLLADHCEDSRGWNAVGEDLEGIVRYMQQVP